MRRRRVLHIAGGFLCGVIGLAVLLSSLFPLPQPKPYSTLIEDQRGRFVHAFRASDGIWRLKTSPAEIPPRLKSILLAREDRWFSYHPGVNPLALVRALYQNLSTGRRVSGASTITMQIARMLEPKERTVGNKALEILRAFQLEWAYSKDELLEMYLSMVPLGGNIEGLQSAALIYYQTPLERLNVAQLFDLMLIPSDPNGLRPDRNGGALLRERLFHARRWLAEGMLTEADSVVLWNTPAGAERHALPREAEHFALRMARRFPGTPVVHSTLDLDIQRKVETLLANHLRPWKLSGVQNGAVLVVENATGAVRAYAGSGAFDDAASQGQVDAVMAMRSPGSTLKPFLYAMQIEAGELTPRTVLLDTPYDAEGFYAENYDGGYDGLVHADEALQRSLNVPMVRMLKHVGLDTFEDFLAREGFVSLQQQRGRLGLSMILGGCGVRLDELVAAFASFPRGGAWRPLRWTDDAPLDTSQDVQVFSTATAYMVTHILSGLERPDLPNNFDYALTLPKVAYKTGTSYGRRDAWCIGYSSMYTIGVWMGNVTNRGNPDLVGSRSAAPLLLELFTSISTIAEKGILRAPANIRTRQVCARSGRPPGLYCSQLIEDMYIDRLSSTAPCAVCTEFLVSTDGKLTYCASCVGDHPYRPVVYAQYPPELVHFWKIHGVNKTLAPPHEPACTRVFAGEGPTILSPSEGMTYFITSPGQQIVLQAGSSVDVQDHRWYVDDAYLGKKRPGEKVFITLRQGTHTVACMDDRGRLSSVSMTVKNAM